MKLEADIAYKKIIGLARKSIIYIDDYINLKTLEILSTVKNNIKDNPSKNECVVVETTVTKKRRFGNEEEPKKEEITKTTRYQRTNQGTNNENKEEKKQGNTRVTRVTVDLEKDEPKEGSICIYVHYERVWYDKRKYQR